MSKDGLHELRFRVLGTWYERLMGLMGSVVGAEPVALVPCSSIHTLFMRCFIDVAFVGADGVVLAAHRAVPPARLLSARGSYQVLERPMRKGWWPQAGSTLVLRKEEVDEV